MNYLNGGYAMIKHNASQKDLETAYKTNRPVLVYDEKQKAHWAVIEETATESVDEETQEPITTYEYSYRLIDEVSGGATLDDIVDSAGNKRFVEGEGNPGTFTGVTPSYCKWSLSGTHLMCVYAGNIATGSNPTFGSNFVEFELPEYIADKIIPVYSSFIETKVLTAYKDNGTSQTMNLIVGKSSNTVFFKIDSDTSFTGGSRGFRVQFDLLIDADYSE